LVVICILFWVWVVVDRAMVARERESRKIEAIVAILDHIHTGGPKPKDAKSYHLDDDLRRLGKLI